MIKPDELRGDARAMYDTWRRIGLSESATIQMLREDGVLPMSDHDHFVANFMSLGLSESEAEIAADGRGPRLVRATTAQSSAATVAETLQDNRRRLIENIEWIAQGIRWSGCSLCLWNGESREQASLREAYFKVFRLAPDDATKLWVIRVVESQWPRLTETGPGSTASSKRSSARRSGSNRCGVDLGKGRRQRHRPRLHVAECRIEGRRGLYLLIGCPTTRPAPIIG